MSSQIDNLKEDDFYEFVCVYLHEDNTINKMKSSHLVGDDGNDGEMTEFRKKPADDLPPSLKVMMHSMSAMPSGEDNALGFWRPANDKADGFDKGNVFFMDFYEEDDYRQVLSEMGIEYVPPTEPV